jgi:hypothetical protein
MILMKYNLIYSFFFNVHWNYLSFSFSLMINHQVRYELAKVLNCGCGHILEI